MIKFNIWKKLKNISIKMVMKNKMASFDLLLASFWNLTIIIIFLFIMLIFILDVNYMKFFQHILTSPEPNVDVESESEIWIRRNKDYYQKLHKIGPDGFKKALLLIQSDFKNLLENKFSLPKSKFDRFAKGALYLEYISDPELKEFMKDPLKWFEPYYSPVVNYFVNNNIRKQVKGSQRLYPTFLDLEQKIIKEINGDMNFKNVKINKDYEDLLLNRGLRTKKIIFRFLVVLDIIFGLLLYNLGLKVSDILSLQFIALLLSIGYYKFDKI